MPAADWKGLEAAAKMGASEVLERGVVLARKVVAKARGELIEALSVVGALVDFASDEKVDLLVVGTRGMTGFKKLVLGSVSSRLVSHAPCPVLVVR